MKDLEQSNEKSFLLSSGNHNHSDDDESRTCGSGTATCSCIRRWGVVSLVIMNVMVAIYYGIFSYYENRGSKGHHNSMFHISKNDKKYTQTQTLGFQIHTGGSPAVINGTDGEMNDECPNRYGLLGGLDADEPELLCYIGYEDPVVDVQERLKIMKAAVESAYAVADPDPHIMKIFIAPEFFFRGIDGAYEFHVEHESGDECGPICTVLQGLEDIVANPNYEDWFFLFGSVIAYEKINQDNMNVNQPYLFYNFAPIYKGYNPDITNSYGKRFILPKRYTSNLDFLTPQRYVSENITYEVLSTAYNTTNPNVILTDSNNTLYNPQDYNQLKYNTAIWNEYSNELINNLGYTFIDYDWIIIDDITMSIEICFDHYRGRALETYMTDIVTGSNALIPKLSSFDDELIYTPIPYTQAQISIISSSGMTINPTSLVLIQNGTVYLQDGLYDDDASIIWINETEGKIDTTLGGSEAIQRTAIITDREVHFEYNVIPIQEKVSVYNETLSDKHNKHKNTTTHVDEALWKIALKGTFSTVLYEPMIVIWEPKDIPNAQLHQV